MNLEITNWKPFQIDKIFDVYTGSDLIMSELEDGDIPIASNSAENNNIAAYTLPIKGRKLFDHTKSISIADRGKFWAFIQPKDFYIATRVKALVCKEYNMLNIQQLAFIVSVLNQESFKFTYGRNCCANLPNINISLPIQQNCDNTPILDNQKRYSEEGYIPDWEWMENYIKSLHHKPLTTKNKSENIPQLDVEKWKEFHVGKLFNINRGKTLSSENKEEFIGDDYSCINGGSVNNGELCKMSKELQEIGFILQEVPSLSLSRVGNAGLTFLQTEPYYIADNAFSLVLNKQKNKFVYLFLSTCLNSEVFKYSYGRIISSEKYMLTAIKLPVQHNADGTIFIDEKHTYSEEGYVPDWQFMEDYIKSLPYGDRL